MATGVVVETRYQAIGGDATAVGAGTFFVAGIAQRGDPTNAILVRGMSDVSRLLGERVSYGVLWDQLQTFFGEGGKRAYVARVCGSSPTTGTLTLKDTLNTIDTLKIDAKSPGSWSSRITVDVVAGVVTNTFRLTVYYDAVPVETYDNLATPAAAVSATQYSDYVVVTDLGSTNAAPANNPKVISATALSAGDDKHASVAASDEIAALARFLPEFGAGIVAIPGQPSSTVGAGLIAHAKANNRIAAICPAVGTTVSAAVTAARSLRATAGAEFSGFFFPWVRIAASDGTIATLSPEGYVAGVRARTVETLGGPWAAPAGAAGAANFITGTELTLTSTDINTLADDCVNPIKTSITGGGIKLYGWRSLSTDLNWRYLSYRDVVNAVAVGASEVLEGFVGRTIDGSGALFTEAANSMYSLLYPIVAAGALYALLDSEGNQIDPGYLIDAGPGINTPDTISRGEVHVSLELRTSPLTELVKVTISKAGLRAAL